MRVTKATLQTMNANLEWQMAQRDRRIRELEQLTDTLQEQLTIYRNHISVMTVGNERLADALSHTVGFLKDMHMKVR